MSGITLSHPLIAGMIDKRLSGMDPAKRDAVKAALAKAEAEAQERARADAATPATLAELAARITRSDSRAATALDEVAALRTDVTRLRALVMEMTAEMEKSRVIMTNVATELGIKV